MWINQVLNNQENKCTIKIGKVSGVKTGKISITGYDPLYDIKMCNQVGAESFPKQGDEILVVELENGQSYCIGKINNDFSSNSSQITIKADSGARIELKNSGDVVINGLTITSDGKIINPTI